MSEEIKELENEEIELGLEKIDTPIIYFDAIGLDTDNLGESIEFNKDEFNNGLKRSSYTAGFFTGLINSGMSVEDAINIILTDKNVDMNVKIADINARATIESSKYQKLEIEKNQL